MQVDKLNDLVEKYIAPIFGIQFNIGAVPPLTEIPNVDVFGRLNTPYILGNSGGDILSGLAQYYLQGAICGTSLMMRSEEPRQEESVLSTYTEWRELLSTHLATADFPTIMRDLFIFGCDDMINNGLMGRSIPAYFYSEELIYPPMTTIQTLANGRHDTSVFTWTLTHNGFQSQIGADPLIDGATISRYGIGWGPSMYTAYPVNYPAINPLLSDTSLQDEIEIVLESSLMDVFPTFTAESWEGENMIDYSPFHTRPYFSLYNINGPLFVGGWSLEFDTFTDYTCALLILAYLQIHNITIHDSNWEPTALIQLAFDEENRVNLDNATKLNAFYTQSLGNTVINLNRAELKKVASQYSETASNRLEEIYQKIETLTVDRFDVLRRVFDKNPHLMLSLFNGL